MSARLRQLTAWVLLLAFCGMTGTKALHHHHWTAAEDVVCPLDGISMSHHTLAHTILQSIEEDDDSDCAICHFTVTKVVLPVCQHFSGGTFTLFLHYFVSTPCEIRSVEGVSLLRAPPVQLVVRS
jgi:hypothetical protein